MTDKRNEMPIKVGDKFKDKHGIYRIMAVAEGYCMARRPRCMAFTRHEKEILCDERVLK